MTQIKSADVSSLTCQYEQDRDCQGQTSLIFLAWELVADCVIIVRVKNVPIFVHRLCRTTKAAPQVKTQYVQI